MYNVFTEEVNNIALNANNDKRIQRKISLQDEQRSSI